MNEYDDIINLPPHKSKIHPPMSMENRAAQFAPFAAMTGHGSAIAETARLTSQKIELTREERERLERRLAYAVKHEMIIRVTYFVPDERKQGGKYVVAEGRVRSIDEVKEIIRLGDNLRIPFDYILSIDSELFDDFD